MSAAAFVAHVLHFSYETIMNFEISELMLWYRAAHRLVKEMLADGHA